MTVTLLGSHRRGGDGPTAAPSGASGALPSLNSILANTEESTPGSAGGLIALTVGLSLVGVVLWGTLAGSMLPFILRRLGFDPASASAQFVATVVDVTGLIIYFTVASVVLAGTLL